MGSFLGLRPCLHMGGKQKFYLFHCGCVHHFWLLCGYQMPSRPTMVQLTRVPRKSYRICTGSLKWQFTLCLFRAVCGAAYQLKSTTPPMTTRLCVMPWMRWRTKPSRWLYSALTKIKQLLGVESRGLVMNNFILVDWKQNTNDILFLKNSLWNDFFRSFLPFCLNISSLNLFIDYTRIKFYLIIKFGLFLCVPMKRDSVINLNLFI